MKMIITLLLLVVFISCKAQYNDKVLHFVAGGSIASITNLHFKNNTKGFFYGVAAGTLAGIGKEAYDKYSGRGRFDYKDALATTVGAIVCSYATSWIKWKRKNRPCKL